MAGIEARNGKGLIDANKIETVQTDVERGAGGRVIVVASEETYTGGLRITQALEKRGYSTDLLRSPSDSLDSLRVLFDNADKLAGYVDIACGGLADERLGGQAQLVTGRLEAAIARGIPAIVAPGGMDIVHWGRRDTVPAKYGRRKLLPQTSDRTLMRTDVADNAILGRTLADLLNGFPNGLGVCLPLRGLSSLSAPGEPFSNRETDMALFGNLITHLRRDIKLYEANYNINDVEFSDMCAVALAEVSPAE